MLVSLYTSRVVLNALGVEDFGIYNVVGGVVSMFGFINTAMAASTQRYLTFELGRGNQEQLFKVFSTSVQIHACIALLIVLLAETIGLWLFYHKMTIPTDRMNAALWVYQFSVLSTVVLIMSVPYNASIIAHERMSAFAYISVVEVLLKLGIVYVLLIGSFDKLKLYALLMFGVQLGIRLIYSRYCRTHFQETVYKRVWDKKLFKVMLGFASWNLWGNGAAILFTQGVNILLNIFFGVFVNAAMGIANQVSGAISLFVGNFQTAFNPQIIKSYASGEKERFINLILNTSKYSYYLLFLIALPCFICCNEILQLWLGEVPPHSVSFCRLLIIFSLIDAVQGPLWVSAQATGDIRNYQLLMSFLILLNLPVSYVILKIIPIAELALVVRVLINLVTAVARVVYLKRLYSFPVARYLKEVVLLGMTVTIVSSLIPSFVYLCSTGWLMVIVTAFLCIACTVMAIYTIGLKEFERNLVKSYINKTIYKLKK